MSTRENPMPVPPPPTETTGTLIEGASASSPARVRGFAPPIIDTLPAPAPAPVVELPRLWLSFHSDGVTLQCSAALQRNGQMRRVDFDADPVLAQGYAYFVKKAMAAIDGVPFAPSTPPPAPAEPEKKDASQSSDSEDDVPTNPDPGRAK